MRRLVILFSLVPGVFAGAAEHSAPALTLVRTYAGVEAFTIDAPAAERSAALRVGVGAQPESGYALTNRIVLRPRDDATAKPLSGLPGVLSVASFAPAPGFWIVTATDVQNAVRLADQLAADPAMDEAYVDIEEPRVTRLPNDPDFAQQWHLSNSLEPGIDLRVASAWDAGYTGAGVVIGIVEDAWQFDHPDLASQLNAEATQLGGFESAHATSCAGLAAAVAFNGQGGVGAAYGAQLSSQHLGSNTQIASALEFRNDLNDVKSNSWGPADDGRARKLPSVIATAVANAAATGRGGLGEVFLWAAGNGGLGDRVDYDPYASSRFAMPIGAIGDFDTRATYNEPGSATFLVAPSNGNNREIFTTTLGSGYDAHFGGTSAASPLAAGVVALVLEANPNLTWRDVQHVLMRSARHCDPADPGWSVNSAGVWVNYQYGFGAIDASAAVNLALAWRNVLPEVSTSSAVTLVAQALPNENPAGLARTVTIPEDLRLETVEVVLTVSSTAVGDIRVVLTGPSGTQSVFATPRIDTTAGFTDQLFTSRRHWGERSAGNWTLTLSDEGPVSTSTWSSFQLRFHGTRRPGDVNCDGRVDFDDIDAFVTALIGADAYEAVFPDCYHILADTNDDGAVNFDDIDSFVVALIGV